MNRHMSIGFTIPIVMLCRGPVADARDIGMIVIGFGKRHIYDHTQANRVRANACQY